MTITVNQTNQIGNIMTNLLSNIVTADNVVVEDKDTLGGGGYEPVASGVYEGVLKYAYLEKLASGTLAMNCEFELETGSTFNQTIYVTNKKGENFYTDKNSGDKKLLPGYILADSLALLGAQKPLAELSTKPTRLKLYDYDEKKEIIKEKPVFDELIGKPYVLGIKKVRENKKTKNGNGDYVPTADVREFNDLDKVFHPKSKLTVNELRASADAPDFHDKWAERWTDNTHDKVVSVAGSGTTAGAPKKPSSLFA